MKRTSTTTDLSGGARSAIQRSRTAEGFTKAPGAAKRTRSKRQFKVTDLREIGLEIFKEDDFRDDTKEEAAKSIGLLNPNPADVLAAGRAEAARKVAAGDAKSYREQQGGIALVGEKGRLKGWVVPPAHRQGGKLAATNELKASKQFERNTDLTYEERARRRIEAIGRSLFQSTGGLTDERRKALTDAYKLDRERRGWKVPDL